MKKLAFIALFALTGCATLFTGTTQNVNVQVLDSKDNSHLHGATCTLIDGEGIQHAISGNPGTAHVHKGKGSLQINCNKAGYKQKSVGASESFNAVSVANILFWPGFLVDAATGSIQKYPTHVTVIMEKE